MRGFVFWTLVTARTMPDREPCRIALISARAARATDEDMPPLDAALRAGGAVTVAIPGTTKESHLEDNQRAARGRLPDAAMRKRMEDFWAGKSTT
jgi:aryl-alcohol dehydrogenase-like predicted oxidoreductase